MKAITKLSRCLTASFIALGLGPYTKATPVTNTVNGVTYTLDGLTLSTSNPELINYAQYGTASPTQDQSPLPWWGDKTLAKSLAETFRFDLGKLAYVSNDYIGAWFNYSYSSLLAAPRGYAWLENYRSGTSFAYNSFTDPFNTIILPITATPASAQ